MHVPVLIINSADHFLVMRRLSLTTCKDLTFLPVIGQSYPMIRHTRRGTPSRWGVQLCQLSHFF